MSDISQTEFHITQKAQQLATISKEEVAQEATEDSLQSAGDNALFVNIARSFVELQRRSSSKKEEEKQAKKEEGGETKIIEVQKVEEIAEGFEEKNPELQSRALLSLKQRLSPKDSQETLLKKVLEAYPDPSLADEALEFLIQTVEDKDLSENLQKAQVKFREIYQKDIAAGKNIAQQSREFSEKGLGTPTALRDLYRDVTQNPREAATLFVELTTAYTFDQLKTVIAFLFHSLGSDLKSKGPSIEKGELANLMKEAKDMQAILGVYRYFRSRMRLISSCFNREGLPLPQKITFELLSKLFVKFLLERYPSAEKLLQLGVQLELEDSLVAEIIIFSQMRDGIRQVSPRLFKSEQHRQETLSLFLEVLKELDEEEEGKEEEEEEEEDESV